MQKLHLQQNFVRYTIKGRIKNVKKCHRPIIMSEGILIDNKGRGAKATQTLDPATSQEACCWSMD